MNEYFCRLLSNFCVILLMLAYAVMTVTELNQVFDMKAVKPSDILRFLDQTIILFGGLVAVGLLNKSRTGRAKLWYKGK